MVGPPLSSSYRRLPHFSSSAPHQAPRETSAACTPKEPGLKSGAPDHQEAGSTLLMCVGGGRPLCEPNLYTRHQRTSAPRKAQPPPLLHAERFICHSQTSSLPSSVPAGQHQPPKGGGPPFLGGAPPPPQTWCQHPGKGPRAPWWGGDMAPVQHSTMGTWQREAKAERTWGAGDPPLHPKPVPWAQGRAGNAAAPMRDSQTGQMPMDGWMGSSRCRLSPSGP